MMHFNATQAKLNFGELIDSARHEPVLIDKNGRAAVVVLSSQEYERLQAVEDQYWHLKADMAKRAGFLTETQSRDLIQNMLSV